jgi:hypothetical protein
LQFVANGEADRQTQAQDKSESNQATMPADVESFGRAAVPNPYRGLGPNHATTGANLLVDKFKRMLYMGVSGFFLHRMNFWGAIVRSPHVSHEWFKIGVAGTIGTLVCGCGLLWSNE